MKQIEFQACEPIYCAAGPTLLCGASVDGNNATYAITAEALEDHFGARSCRSEDLVQAFSGHRNDIEAVARAMFEMTGSKQITLHSGHFRFRL
ncbi:DUF1488 domain-containing protein [Ralstonia insidiosa]|jgi:hypothetical protein|uniref:DUF1488 domain-containing protein n=1 Tax=Ralstonia insidiosa TaxID=190721 RepID=A0A192A3M1_9RALS|nr:MULTISPECIES: DUF1488 domain-containing protein [Ralstonia]KMW48591.1 hypothetical protein AC240_03465 [Ralstonia sp. MD27]MBX3772696.1 DUF1488 domain-containing protein [Ralstonia pickettii]NOZ17616.1 DUF1488 domain-containing protein [Betaproteobacteria bacterium]ANH76931.1 hypothetical protein ACS15_4580 [Ralstonia insidiosa]ANJ75075.1 hypothetical protein A9Y76_21320 [Ralstonia insidiosa]